MRHTKMGTHGWVGKRGFLGWGTRGESAIWKCI